MNQKIRFIGRYGDYRIGEVIAPPASLRKLLLDRKLVEIITEKEEQQLRSPQPSCLVEGNGSARPLGLGDISRLPEKAAKKKWR